MAPHTHLNKQPTTPRSKRLTRFRPIVILDLVLPEPGGGWEDIAKLKDVWFCQVGFSVEIGGRFIHPAQQPASRKPTANRAPTNQTTGQAQQRRRPPPRQRRARRGRRPAAGL
jgi:hypothetical protein